MYSNQILYLSIRLATCLLLFFNPHPSSLQLKLLLLSNYLFHYLVLWLHLHLGVGFYQLSHHLLESLAQSLATLCAHHVVRDLLRAGESIGLLFRYNFALGVRFVAENDSLDVRL